MLWLLKMSLTEETRGREKTTAKSKGQGERVTELPQTDSIERKLL